MEITGSTISGSTILDIHTFIDDYGNVTQINKVSKSRLKYYVDDRIPQPLSFEPCVIGISGLSGATNCSLGVGLGLGDNNYGFAKYTE